MSIRTPQKYLQSRLSGFIGLFTIFFLVLAASFKLTLSPEVSEIVAFVCLFGFLTMRRRFKRSGRFDMARTSRTVSNNPALRGTARAGIVRPKRILPNYDGAVHG